MESTGFRGWRGGIDPWQSIRAGAMCTLPRGTKQWAGLRDRWLVGYMMRKKKRQSNHRRVGESEKKKKKETSSEAIYPGHLNFLLYSARVPNAASS